MSIATRTGETGSTGLMYNRRVPKTHPQVEACGAVDELNAALGLARTTVTDPARAEFLVTVQRHLIGLMGELATAPEDFERYRSDGYARLSGRDLELLDAWVGRLESGARKFDGWATPGANRTAALLDFARSVCRRAERRVCALQLSGALPNAEILVYLNRLSDVLWLLARAEENPA